MANKVLPKDSNRTDIPTARGFVCHDASGTPKVSPYSLTSTEVALVFPENAVELVIVNTSQDIRIATTATYTGGGGTTEYATVGAGTGTVIQMGEGGTIYMRAASTTATVDFYFRTL